MNFSLLGFFFHSRSSNVTFPSFTICPDFADAYKTDKLSKYNVTASDVRRMNFPKIENMTSSQFYHMVTYDLEELLIDMFITTHMNSNSCGVS